MKAMGKFQWGKLKELPDTTNSIFNIEQTGERWDRRLKITLKSNNKVIVNVNTFSYDSKDKVDIDYIKNVYYKDFTLHDSLHSSEYIEHFLDDLYYSLVPINLLKKNGDVFKTKLNQYIRRIDNNPFLNNITSTKLQAQITSYYKQVMKFANPHLVENTFEYNKTYNKLIPTILLNTCGICTLSNKPFDKFNNKYYKRYFNGIKDTNIIYVGYLYLRDIERGNIKEYTNIISSSPSGHTVQILLDQYHMIYETGHVIRKEALTSKKTCSCCNKVLPTVLFEDPDVCVVCEESRYKIHNYTTRVEQLLSFKAKKVKKDTLYLGCELEYETTDRHTAQRKVGKLLAGHAIMKSDGSIHNGFEIVTCPATSDIHKEVFKNFYNNKPTEIHKAPNVGMHIHISREPLSTLTIGKLTRFMNSESNKKYLELIAGRQQNSYCSQSERRSRDLSYAMYNKGERYNILNISPPKTIEFRMFSTPESYEEFAHKLEFVEAIVEYSKPCVCPVPAYQHRDFNNFKLWVLKTPKVYPHLSSLLKTFA